MKVTVAELLRVLQQDCKPDDEVVLQADPEGNWYADLEAVSLTEHGKVILLPHHRKRRDP